MIPIASTHNYPHTYRSIHEPCERIRGSEQVCKGKQRITPDAEAKKSQKVLIYLFYVKKIDEFSVSYS